MQFISFLGQAVTVAGLPIPLAALAIIGFIIILFSQSIWELVLQASRVGRDLSHASHVLTRIKSKVNEGMLTELDTDFLQIGCLQEPWQAFLGILIYPKQKDDNRTVYRTRSSESFFNRKTIIDKNINTYFLSSVPGLLTGLGLIGTFLSIFVGLNFLQVNGDVVDGVQPFINNLSGKFLSSLVGLCASFVYVLVERKKLGAVASKCMLLQQRIDQCFVEKAPEKLICQLRETLEAQNQTITQLSQDFAGSVKEVLCGGDDSPLVALVRSNHRLVEIGEDSVRARNEELSKLVAETARMFKDSLTEATNAEFQKLGNAISEISIATSGIGQRISQSLTQVDQMVHAQNEAMQSLVGSVEVISNHMLTTQEQSTSAILTQTSTQIDSLLSRFDQSTDAQQKSMTASVDYIVNNVRAWTDSASAQLESVLDAGASEEQSRRNASDDFCALVRKLADIANQSSASAIQLKQFDSSLVDISEQLHSTTKMLKQVHEGTQAVAGEFAQSSDSLQLALRESRRLPEPRYQILHNKLAHSQPEDSVRGGNGLKSLINNRDSKS